MEAIAEWYNQNQDFANPILVLVITAILYLAGVLFLGSLIRRVVASHGRQWHRKDIEKRQKTLEVAVLNIWRVTVLFTGGLFFVQQAFPHINLSPLFASAGIIGVAIGFGAQSLVKDFISGIFIVSENQYRVGDIIEIEGFAGTVERIGARSTVVRDAEGNVHYFPNGMVQHVINKTMGYSMSRFMITVAPTTDIENTIEVINKIGVELSKEAKWKTKIIEPPKFISIGDFTATNVTIVIAGKTQPSDQWSVTSEMRRRLFEAFETKDIKLGGAAPAATSAKK